MKIGIIGTGMIVERMLDSIKENNSIHIGAVYSRTMNSAQQFADVHKIPLAFDNVETMLIDGRIDAVYVASPNSLHYSHAKLCLLYQKHVFVEKPMFGNLEKAEEIFEFALKQGCYLFETIYSLYLPNFDLLKDNLYKIGDISLIECNFSKKSSRYDALLKGELPNVFNPKFSGGALADLNSYQIQAVVQLLGSPEKAWYDALVYDNGIDLTGVAILRYPKTMAVCIASKQSGASNYAKIQGSLGDIVIGGGFNRFEFIDICIGGEHEILNVQTQHHMSYQFEKFRQAIEQKNQLFFENSMQQSLKVIRLLCKLRLDIGLDFEY